MTSLIGRRITSPNSCFVVARRRSSITNPTRKIFGRCHDDDSIGQAGSDDDDDDKGRFPSRSMLMGSDTCNLLHAFQESVFGNNDEYSSIRHSILLCLSIVVVSFIVSTATGNYSQVDKAWSIVPVIYSWIVVRDDRTLLMAILATVWGVRLTWNFNRRGGYSWPPWTGDEDYRWKYLQDGALISWLKYPIVWIIFNFGFISLFQHVLLWLIASPSVVASLVSSSCGISPLNFIDIMATLMFLAAVIIESVADNQQYEFQIEKYRQRKEDMELKGEYKDGFKQSGLFAIVRKPNYAAEQLVWISFYFFSIAATNGKQLWNWSGMGFILLCVLFQGSGWFTENITISKYPKYKDYQKATPLYMPNLFQFLSRKNKLTVNNK